MKRLTLILTCVLVCLAAMLTGAAADGLVVTWPEESRDWPWKVGTEHTAEVVITNTTNASIKNVTVTLTPVHAGSSEETSIFTLKNGRKLGSKERGTSYKTKEIKAGASLVLTVSWTPEGSLSAVNETVITATADCEGGSVSAALRIDRTLAADSKTTTPKKLLIIIWSLAGANVILFGWVVIRRRKAAKAA